MHHGAHIGGHADIDAQRARSGTQARRHIERGLEVQVGDQHLRALGNELARYARAEDRTAAAAAAAAGDGDDGDFVFQSHAADAIKLWNGLRFFQR